MINDVYLTSIYIANNAQKSACERTLLDQNLRAKLTDFGLSALKSESTSATGVANQVVGTLAWMSPELLSLKPQYSKKSDMCGYGMVLWELASRELPFKGVDQLTRYWRKPVSWKINSF